MGHLEGVSDDCCTNFVTSSLRNILESLQISDSLKKFKQEICNLHLYLNSHMSFIYCKPI